MKLNYDGTRAIDGGKANLEKEYLVVVKHLSLGALLKKIIQKISQIW